MREKPLFDATHVTTILGLRGSGKTTLSRKIQGAYPRVVVFDRLREYEKEKGKDVAQVDGFEDFLRALRWSVGKPSFKIIYKFDIEADSHDEEFNEAQRLLYYRGNVCIVVEEVWNFASAHYLPKWFQEQYLTGRHRKNAIITTSQRPATVHKTILSQSHHIFCGQLHEKNDLKYLSEVLGKNAEILPDLQDYKFLHFRPGQKPRII